jgi:quinol-cytochrome oxidoreductase complex cytochrome b subunit
MKTIDLHSNTLLFYFLDSCKVNKNVKKTVLYKYDTSKNKNFTYVIGFILMVI